MTTISAKIIADSVSLAGKRLTTLQLRYPRWIHAEGRTHRKLRIGEEDPDYGVEYGTGVVTTPSLMENPDLSRNASSSRAIPVKTLIQDVLKDPAIPLYWGADQKGMQAGDECNALLVPGNRPFKKEWTREEAWLSAMNGAIEWAMAFDAAGYHKQIVNRLLEPFSHINVVVTATEWSNFFALRAHPDAEPHIQHLARAMAREMALSNPILLQAGEWHLPYVTPEELAFMGGRKDPTGELRLISTARNARVSYKTHDGRRPMPKEDLELAHRLIGAVPLHASPAEHQGTPDADTECMEHWGNFVGWVQYRKTLPGECQ